MKNQKTLYFFFIASVSFLNMNGQNISPWEVGLYTGASLYTGDLTPAKNGSYRSPGLLIGMKGYRRITNSLKARADVMYTKLRSADALYNKPEWRQQRNFEFKTRVAELSIGVEYAPFEGRLSPYVFGGVGYSFLKVNKDYSNTNLPYFNEAEQIAAGIAADEVHGSPNGKFVLPVGAGISYALNDRLSLTVETGYRFMSTDYLDGFSFAANPKKKDNYYTHSIGLVWRFPGKNLLACPRN